MFAVIETGGKQYKVAKNDVIFVEKLDGDAGAEITFDHVMMIGDGETRTVGRPYIAGAAVVATVLEQTLGPKLIIFKKKRRQNYRRKRGHRQPVSVLRIMDIVPSGAARSAASTEASDAKPAKKARPAKNAEASS
ncbi:MAG: 50S ribosomal protein L21 [Alphaproteobacteria bacterium]